MKVLLDIEDNSRPQFFMEMIQGLSYVKILKEIDDTKTGEVISDLTEAFNDVALHLQGKKRLKSAKELFEALDVPPPSATLGMR
jgi:hypothetical protein